MHKKLRRTAVSPAIATILALIFVSVAASDQPAGQVVFSKGDVVHYQPTLITNPPAQGAAVSVGHRFVTRTNGFVSLSFRNSSQVSIQPDSDVTVSEIDCSKTPCVISLHAEHGSLNSSVEPGATVKYSVTTPFLSAAVRGTRFYVDVAQQSSKIGVTQGLVATDVATTTHPVAEGKGLLARDDTPPELVDLLESPALFASSQGIYSAEDTLYWAALSGAESYQTIIARDESLLEPTVVNSIKQNYLTLPQEITPGQYYLSVAGVDTRTFVGLPAVVPVFAASIQEDDPLELELQRRGREIEINPIEYSGTVELVISDSFTNPTFEDRLPTDLSSGLTLQSNADEDRVIKARKVFSNTVVSAYSDLYLFKATE